jgi:heme A synthase
MVARYRQVAVAALGFTLFVVLWGALVRITGAGAGCGAHWPTCNGQVIPRAPATSTIIEFTHRLTTVGATVLVLGELVLARVAFPKGHAARRFAALSVLFMATEAAIGAGLVLFELVAGDKSLARGYAMSAHLCNTFLLVAAMLLAVLAARPIEPRPSGARAWIDAAPRARVLGAFVAAAVVTISVGVTGAIAALGDTLFPATSLAEGIRADFSPSAHAFLALRTTHPFAAVLGALLGLALASAALRSSRRSVRAWATTLAIAIVAQVGAGIVKLLLLAPAPMQLLHLLLADTVWICIVGLGWASLASASPAILVMVGENTDKEAEPVTAPN